MTPTLAHAPQKIIQARPSTTPLTPQQQQQSPQQRIQQQQLQLLGMYSE